MIPKFSFNIIFRNTTWISYRFHLRQSNTWCRRNFGGISLHCSACPIQVQATACSWISPHRLLDAPLQRGRREPNTACFAWEGPELDISAARLAALQFSSFPPGRYRGRPIPRPTPSQSTIRPISWCCFLGHCTLSGRWIPWFHPDDGVCSADKLVRTYLTRTRRPR